MREAYKEYVKEHPEELVGINRLKHYTRMVEKDRGRRKNEALRTLHKWKEKLGCQNLEQSLTERQRT